MQPLCMMQVYANGQVEKHTAIELEVRQKNALNYTNKKKWMVGIENYKSTYNLVNMMEVLYFW